MYLLCFGALVLAQSALHVDDLQSADYGVQVVNSYLPSPAPLGYESVAVTKLNLPLYKGRTYTLKLKLSAKAITGKTYRLNPTVIASPELALPYTSEWPAKHELEVLHEQPTMQVKGNGNKVQSKTYSWKIKPVREYQFITLVILDSDLQGVGGQARADLEVSGLFLEVDPLPQEKLELAKLSLRSLRPLALSRVNIPSIDAPQVGKTPRPSAYEGLVEASTKPSRIAIQNPKAVHLPTGMLRVGLYDHKKVDGDIVTIFINDRILVDSYTLTDKIKYFDIPLYEGENELVLHAENLGEIEPNTAAVILESGGNKQEVILRSDLQRSEYVRLIGI